MLKRLAPLTILFFLFPAQLANGWSNEGHGYINQVAVQKLPETMPFFLRNAASRIAYLGPEPDRWRSESEYTLKTAQEPEHYIDLELLQGLGELPKGRFEFYRLLS